MARAEEGEEEEAKVERREGREEEGAAEEGRGREEEDRRPGPAE